ncbi:hypothetical protein HMPREF9946_02747 [Acetobacteraceae bacterium AT-5844]|nr:hypothetical protein HMPREF9946_02747 [Acetobacteraceae bacterium AT-5844]
MGAMSRTPLPPRPAASHETLIGRGQIEAPIVALFENAAMAEAAILHTGATVLGDRSPGVVMLAAAQGLRERLYAAGAMLVVS